MNNTFYSPNDYRYYLIHYGVKGMRWGVRKDNRVGSGRGRRVLDTYLKVTSPLGYAIGKRTFNNFKKGASFIREKSVKAKPKIQKKLRNVENKRRNLMGSKQSAAVKKYRNKNIDGMSDKDLQKAVNRMNLEQQYRNLTKVDYMRGQRYAQDILKYKKTVKSIRG